MKLRILHLEDNSADADLVRLALYRGGLNCDILPVNNADAYLSALQRPEFDVILSDSGVPGCAGDAALAAPVARAQRRRDARRDRHLGRGRRSGGQRGRACGWSR